MTPTHLITHVVCSEIIALSPSKHRSSVAIAGKHHAHSLRGKNVVAIIFRERSAKQFPQPFIGFGLQEGGVEMASVRFGQFCPEMGRIRRAATNTTAAAAAITAAMTTAITTRPARGARGDSGRAGEGGGGGEEEGVGAGVGVDVGVGGRVITV